MMINLFSHYLLPVAIAYIMFGIGITLHVGDFKVTFKNPKAIVLGVLAQMISLPLMALVINYFFDISPVYKAGLMLIAICPGGTTSSLVTFFLKGNLALAVALTVITSFLIIFTIPTIMHITLQYYEGMDRQIALPLGVTIGNMFVTVLLPTLIGMVVKRYFNNAITKWARFINISMTVFLIFVFAGVFIFENTGTTAEIPDYLFLFVPTFLLNFLSMFVSYYLARGFKLNNEDRYTIAIQVGLQNSALAIFVSSKLLGQPEMAIVAIIYASFTLFSSTFWAWLMKKHM